MLRSERESRMVNNLSPDALALWNHDRRNMRKMLAKIKNRNHVLLVEQHSERLNELASTDEGKEYAVRLISAKTEAKTRREIRLYNAAQRVEAKERKQAEADGHKFANMIERIQKKIVWPKVRKLESDIKKEQKKEALLERQKKPLKIQRRKIASLQKLRRAYSAIFDVIGKHVDVIRPETTFDLDEF